MGQSLDVRLWLSPFFIRDLGAPSLRTIECSESLSFFGSSSILNLSRDIGCSILVGTECIHNVLIIGLLM